MSCYERTVMLEKFWFDILKAKRISCKNHTNRFLPTHRLKGVGGYSIYFCTSCSAEEGSIILIDSLDKSLRFWCIHNHNHKLIKNLRIAILPALPLSRCMLCTYAVLREVFPYHSGPFWVSQCRVTNRYSSIQQGVFSRKSGIIPGSYLKIARGAWWYSSYRVPLPGLRVKILFENGEISKFSSFSPIFNEYIGEWIGTLADGLSMWELVVAL